MAVWRQYSHLFINLENFGYSFYFTNSSHLCDIFFTGNMAIFTVRVSDHTHKTIDLLSRRKSTGTAPAKLFVEKYSLNQFYVPVVVPGIKEECRETIAFSYFDGLPVSPPALGNRIFVE
jgi:hypothetical protein